MIERLIFLFSRRIKASTGVDGWPAFACVRNGRSDYLSDLALLCTRREGSCLDQDRGCRVTSVIQCWVVICRDQCPCWRCPAARTEFVLARLTSALMPAQKHQSHRSGIGGQKMDISSDIYSIPFGSSIFAAYTHHCIGARSPVRRCSRQPRTIWLLALSASGLIASVNEVKILPFLPMTCRGGTRTPGT